MTAPTELDLQIDEFLDHYLTTTFGEAPAYDESSNFTSELNLDSLDFLSLIAEIEQRWDITIDDLDMTIERFATVAKVRAYVHGAVGTLPAP